MTALCIIIGIIVFFLLILSIRININGEYFDTFKLNISWLFLKFPLFPMKKKEKKEKDEPANDSPQEEEEKDKDTSSDESENKKENIFIRFYHNQGFDGVIELINNTAYSLARMLDSFKKHIVMRELYLWMTVCGGDAADTALEYGRLCQKVFPALSFICSTLPVRKYDAEVEPDFLGNRNKAQFVFKISVRPIFIINALLVLVFRLIFKVVIKFLMGIRNKSKTNENINEGGTL